MYQCSNALFMAAVRQVGIVQTAYANGASTQYIERHLQHCQIRRTPTGVKHLHAAAEEFDVGIYFEANGHGTILFNAAFVKKLHKVLHSASPFPIFGSMHCASQGSSVQSFMPITLMLLQELQPMGLTLGLTMRGT